MVSTIPSGAGFLPSTVCTCFQQQQQWKSTIERHWFKTAAQTGSHQDLVACQMQLLMADNSKRRLKLNEFVSFSWVASQCTNLVHGCSRLPFQEHGKGHDICMKNSMEYEGWIPTSYQSNERDLPELPNSI